MPISPELVLFSFIFLQIQAYFGFIAGSVPDHSNKTSHMNFFISSA
jgi:hypothetical protein